MIENLQYYLADLRYEISLSSFLSPRIFGQMYQRTIFHLAMWRCKKIKINIGIQEKPRYLWNDNIAGGGDGMLATLTSIGRFAL